MADGLITIASSFQAKETVDRLEAEIHARGMTVFAASITRLAQQRLVCHCGQPRS